MIELDGPIQILDLPNLWKDHGFIAQWTLLFDVCFIR